MSTRIFPLALQAIVWEGNSSAANWFPQCLPCMLSAWCTETLPLAMPVMIEFGYIIELLIPKRVFSIFFLTFIVLYFVFTVLVNGFGAIII